MGQRNGRALTLFEMDRSAMALRRSLRPGEQLLAFASTQQIDRWLAVPGNRASCRLGALTRDGIYVIVCSPDVQIAPRASRPGWWLVPVILAPLAIVAGLLIWQPLWTLGTIGALTVLLICRGGAGSHRHGTFVETITRVRVR